MWSEKKYIDYIINGLLFLLGMNFLHFGQFALPIICLILFVDNKCKLKINNMKTFIILCLFAISFFAFSYKQGFYSVMGFCLPMAYYIGGNIKTKNKRSVVKIIYLLAFGMSMHLVLNMMYELICHYNFDILYMLTKRNHYDIWVQDLVNTTGTAVNCIFIYSLAYYSFLFEKNKYYKYISIVLFLLTTFYCICLGRRTSLFIFFISIILAFILDVFSKFNSINKEKMIKTITIIVTLILLLIIVYILNIFGIKDIFNNLFVIKKLITYGLNSGRLEILLSAIKIAPQHLFGGNEISNELGSWIHDLWGDIYDQAGIVSFLLMVIYSIESLKDIILLCKTNKDYKYRNLILVWFICISLIMFVEPIMSGCSIFLISVVIVLAAIKENIIFSES